MHGTTPNDVNGKKRRMDWDPLDLNSNADIGPSEPKAPNLCNGDNGGSGKERDRRNKNANGGRSFSGYNCLTQSPFLYDHTGCARVESRRMRWNITHSRTSIKFIPYLEIGNCISFIIKLTVLANRHTCAFDTIFPLLYGRQGFIAVYSQTKYSKTSQTMICIFLLC